MEIFDFKKLNPLRKSYAKYINEQMKKENLSASYVSFIEALGKQKFHSQQELTDYIGCDKAHTSRTLFKMQLKGLVKLSCAKKTIELTEKGKQLTQKISQSEKEYLSMLAKGITESERKNFNEILDKMISNSNSIGV